MMGPAEEEELACKVRIFCQVLHGSVQLHDLAARGARRGQLPPFCCLMHSTSLALTCTASGSCAFACKQGTRHVTCAAQSERKEWENTSRARRAATVAVAEPASSEAVNAVSCELAAAMRPIMSMELEGVSFRVASATPASAALFGAPTASFSSSARQPAGSENEAL
jgi:hypothetical protein